MRRIILTALALASAGTLVTGQAQAAQFVSCGGGSNCANTDENVLLTTATNVTTVNGVTNQTNAPLTFTSGTDRLNAEASGQSTITAVDQILNSLTFTLTGFTFQTAEFNLFNGATNPVTVALTTNTGSTQSFTLNSPNGANRFAIVAQPGELLTSATFTSAGGFDSFRQLRLGGIAGAIPEPGTWAMMLIGFGAIGFSMRRRRVQLLQAA